jgi:hypothetical protein
VREVRQLASQQIELRQGTASIVARKAILQRIAELRGRSEMSQMNDQRAEIQREAIEDMAEAKATEAAGATRKARPVQLMKNQIPIATPVKTAEALVRKMPAESI